MADRSDYQGDDSTYPTPAVSTSSLQLARILVVDSEGVERFRTSSDLKQAGAIVDFVADEVTALDSALQALRLNEPYDLVILDTSTLIDEGLSIAEQLRAMQFLGPILALTDEPVCLVSARYTDAGCDEFLEKPVDARILLDLSATLVCREKARRYMLAQPDEVTSELAAYPDLKMMLRRFVSNLPDTIESLMAAQRQHDIDKLRDELDLIKRNATSHGYLEIRASAVSAQQELNHTRKPDAEQVTEAIDELINICRRATVSPSKPPPPSSGPPLPPSG